MKGYKAFDENLQCKGFQFKIGEVFSVEGGVTLCKNGFHFCKQLTSVYNYYSRSYSTRICEVEAVGVIVTEGDKIVTDSIRIIRELSKEDIKRLTDDLKLNSGNYNYGYRTPVITTPVITTLPDLQLGYSIKTVVGSFRAVVIVGLEVLSVNIQKVNSLGSIL